MEKNQLEEDFKYLKDTDPFFNFESTEEWAEFLKETGETV